MILIDILVYECKTLPRSEYSKKAGRCILALTTWPYLCEHFFFTRETRSYNNNKNYNYI